MEETGVKYPIGQQDFKILRQRGLFYVDKTHFISKIINDGSQFFFLARPRRFGKSLFLSTLRYFFEGERELFRGLNIDSADWDWQPYPVLRIDLNVERYSQPDVFDKVMDNIFREWEQKYGLEDRVDNLSLRFRNIIKAAHESTGRRVVILVDEYDKPLVGNLNRDSFGCFREKLASIYSNFKSSSEHIRLVFLTGVSRFSKLSVFSDLNNLNDISFDNEYAEICGITESELTSNFSEGIEVLALRRKVSYEEACLSLRRNYDGYRFTPEGCGIYNPWSVLNCLSKGRIGAYWNATGAASVIAETLYNTNINIEKMLNARWSLDSLAGLDLCNADPTALLYQTGYLTIADYDFDNDTVKLKVPNEEVKKGLFNDLLPFYLNDKRGFAGRLVADIIESIREGKPREMMKTLEAYFASIPYDLKIENENNFQNALYILLTLIGINTKAEAHTSDGRIDLLIETKEYIYIIELKYDATPDEALSQIEEKHYDSKFAADARKIFKIGASFSSTTRRIASWKIA